MDGDGDPDSEFSLNEEVEKDNPGALPTDPLDDATRRYHLLRLHTEKRGRKSELGWKEILKMDRIIEEYGEEARQLSWQALAFEAGCKEVSGRTVQRAMGTMGYRQCVACRKEWVNPSNWKYRVEYAKIMLERYPNPEDWKNVRFLDEVDLGYGPLQTGYVIRKPGQRYRPDCIIENPPKENKASKREHGWAAVVCVTGRGGAGFHPRGTAVKQAGEVFWVAIPAPGRSAGRGGERGWNFKSDMVLYNTKSSNGKMSHEVYVNQILDPVVGQSLRNGDDFVLEEDGESGHGGCRNAWNPLAKAVGSGPSTKKENIVLQWKREHGLKFYFNYHSSPELSPIENCWHGPKQRVKQIGHFDAETTNELIYEGWGKVSQGHINKRILSIPKRFRDVIAIDGAMTGN